jgi:integrase/recombinase XerD
MHTRRWRKETHMQLSALVDEFLLDCRARRLSPRTIAWYRGNLRYFLDWLAEQGAPDHLASFTLQQARRCSHALTERSVRQGTFVSDGGRRGVHALIETDRPLSANTVSGYLRTLKVFSRWLAAEEQGYLERHLLAGLRLPKRPQTHKEPLTQAEMEQLLADYNLRNPIGVRDFTNLLTYLGTGLRATELTALLLDDVHLEEGYLRVRSGKGNKTRAVNLPPEVARAMARYREHYRPATADPHFFVSRTGTPLRYTAIGQLLTRAS